MKTMNWRIQGLQVKAMKNQDTFQEVVQGPGSLQSTKGLKNIDSCTLRTRPEPLWGAVRIPTVNRFPQDNLYASFNRKTTQEVYNSRQTSLFFLFTTSILTSVGFPGGSVVKEYTCQCRRHRFHSQSGKSPHAAEQLSPWATVPGPVLKSTGAAPARAYAPQSLCSATEKPLK